MRGSIIILILLLTGCSSPSSDKIIVPKLHAGFYSEALDRIDDELKSTPDDERLIDQKLFYCEQLDWPTTCISALDSYKELHGMTAQLVEQYIIYHQNHNQYQQILDLIDRWGEEYDLGTNFTQTYIHCLTRLEKRTEATIELREYLKNDQSHEAIEFASKQYLSLGDTAMATYNLGKLYKLDKNDTLMWNYGQLLVSLGYSEQGFLVMDNYVKERSDDIEIQLIFARLLERSNNSQKARNVLKPFDSKDTVAYLLADWYQKEQLWDSAGLMISSVIADDSLARKPVWKLGRLYEDRGWLLTSIPYFEYLLEMNADDTLAQQRIDLIQRKIAYLQRLKFEEEKIPTIELQPKTIEN